MIKKDLRNAKKEWLLTTVTPENFQTVLGLLQSRNEQAVDIAKRMLRLPMTSDFTRNELIYKIEKLYVPKKPKFSDEQINKLVSLIQSFNETTIEQLTSQQAQILFDDETFPPDLYSEVYSKVSTSNPALMLLLKARCLGFSQANFKSFHQHIDALYSAKPKERKRTMLALKDSEDKSLLTVFKYLMQDPDPEIQFEAIHTVADIFNAYASDNKPLHLFPEEKEIRQLLYDSHDSVIVATLDLIDSMGHEGFPEELLKLSKHKNTEVKKAAIETIEGIEPEGGMKRLIELMEDNDWSIRQLAARAMKGYDNRSQYTSQIEKIYLKEKDPFVKETLFNYVKRSSNSAIGDFFRKMAGGLDAVKKENAMIKLFGMKAASYADIEKARKHFYKTKNPAFHKAWIEAASSRNFNIKPEIIHLLKSGTTAGLETGVSYAGEKRINLTDHLSEEKIALISGKTLLRYIQKNKSLKTKAKITLLKRVLQISEDYSLTSALTSFLGSLPRKQLKSQRNHSISVSSSRDLQFSQEELQELRQVLNQRLPKLKGTNLFISKLFIAVDGTDDYYQKWMSHKPQSSEKYFFAQAWSYLLNQKGTDFIQKYSESLANMISNLGISFYYFNEALPLMNAKDGLKIYTNAKEDYKDNLIKFVATAMTLAELQKEIKTLLDKDILSEYSLSEIFMAKLAKANAKEAQATLKLAKEYKIDNWQYMRLYQSISADVKKEMMQQAM